ncbi:MAG: DUF3093 domain-containing protein [Actinobacteria bacterium]|nr:DUF3093 domain-containing protein [Actinomycetota bacterium]
MSPSPSPSPGGYHERLTPAWWVWLVAAGFAGSFGVVLSRVDGTAALVVTVVVLVLVVVALVRTTAVVSVDPELFVAGRARLPVGYVGGVEALDAEAMRRARSVELDARAYLCLRGWVAGGVRVRLDDPQDDTPYWLVSTRRPERLAAALETARSGHRRV